MPSTTWHFLEAGISARSASKHLRCSSHDFRGYLLPVAFLPGRCMLDHSPFIAGVHRSHFFGPAPCHFTRLQEPCNPRSVRPVRQADTRHTVAVVMFIV